MFLPGGNAKKLAALRQKLLGWYAASRRDLPWRRTRDPYAIWLSEIMLQQTRVAAVIERYRQFLTRFPTASALARADEQDVLALWSGLGYYRRARMLHAAAKKITEEFNGQLPATTTELRQLPGVGAYTAAAIASIAHGEAVAVVDGNVERVVCRMTGLDAADGKAAAKFRREIEAIAAQLLDPKQPGDFNQAMMELGATVCTPRSPQCRVCPWRQACATQGEHKTAPKPKMQSREVGYALVVREQKQTGVATRAVLLEQRPAEQSVMPGLWELPSLREPQISREQTAMTLRHAIMQVNYIARIREVAEEDVDSLTIAGGKRRWVGLDEAAGMALTGLARKALTRAGLIE